MSLSMQASLNRVLIRFYKSITLLLFFILPVRVSRIFVSISVAALLIEMRSNLKVEEVFDVQKLNVALKTQYGSDVIALPLYTLDWFWGDSFKSSNILIKNQIVSFKEAVCNDEIFNSNKFVIIEHVIANLPSSLGYKLNVENTRNRRLMKRDITSLVTV